MFENIYSVDMKASHEDYMKLCLELGTLALEKGDPPVGSVVVFEDEVIGRGIESGKSTMDITNHAEILAVRDAIENGHEGKLSNSRLYSTHEPCIMCSYLLRHHHIPLIVFGLPVEHIGGHTSKFEVLGTEDVPKWGKSPEVVGGILKNEIQYLNLKFSDLQK